MIFSNSYNSLLILSLLSCFASLSFCLYMDWDEKVNYGQPCSGYGCNEAFYLKCQDSACKCKRKAVASYTKKAEIHCLLNPTDVPENPNIYRTMASKMTMRTSSMMDYIKKDFNENTNVTCNPPCLSDQFCNKAKFCQCNNETLVVVDGKCYEASYVKPHEKCFVGDGVVYLCDYNQLSYCRDSICKCYRNYYYHPDNETCGTTKPKVQKPIIVMDVDKTTLNESCTESSHCPVGSECRSDNKCAPRSRKGMPDESCRSSIHCIEGLYCGTNNKCACPSPCHYKPNEGICDCGFVEFGTPVAVVWVGCILGLISVIMWICLIKRTYRKRRAKSETNINQVPKTTEHEENNDVPLMSYRTSDEETEQAVTAPKMSSLPEMDPPPPYPEDEITNARFNVNPPPSSGFTPWNVAPPTYSLPLTTPSLNNPLSSTSVADENSQNPPNTAADSLPRMPTAPMYEPSVPVSSTADPYSVTPFSLGSEPDKSSTTVPYPTSVNDTPVGPYPTFGPVSSSDPSSTHQIGSSNSDQTTSKSDGTAPN